MIIRYLYNIIYPGQQLKIALPWDLLYINDGTLQEDAYYNNTHEFKATNNIVQIPIKTNYLVY